MLNDRLFISAIVLITAGLAIKWINQSQDPLPVSSASHPILVVPEFQDDERGQFRELFVQQVNASLETASKSAEQITTLSSFITDREAALLNAKRYKALAIVFSPKVVRISDKAYICFQLMRADTKLSRAFPPTPAEIDEKTLKLISEALQVTEQTSSSSVASTEIGTRLEALEERVAKLEEASRHEVRQVAQDIPFYRQKHALVVGVDHHRDLLMPTLHYAVSDAMKMRSYFETNGYNVATLLNEDATSDRLLNEINKDKVEFLSTVYSDDFDKKSKYDQTFDDLFIFYFSGSGMTSDEIKSPFKVPLILGLYDTDLNRPLDTSNLQSIVDAIYKLPNKYKLIILDTCWGTWGLHSIDILKSDKVFQVLSGSQDFELASEFGGGGIFTRALLDVLNTISPHENIKMDSLYDAVSSKMVLYRANQHPKLVTIAGTGQVVLEGSSKVLR